MNIPQPLSVFIDLDQEKQIQLETGKLAQLATGAVVVRMNQTVLLVTCCESKQPRPNIDFFPLTVDFEERLYSVGRVPGSYNRREGRPNDKAILASRLIDRPIRPLFPEGYTNDVQIICTVLSSDQEDPTDVLGVLGASAAITLAGLPFMGPIGAVRIGVLAGEFIVNPTYAQLKGSPLDLVVAGNEKNILMVEAGANFVPEDTILAGIDFAQRYIREQIAKQRELAALCKVQPREFIAPAFHDDLYATVKAIADAKLTESVEAHTTDKNLREALSEQAYSAVQAHFEGLPADDPLREKAGMALAYTKKLEKEIMRRQIMQKGLRVDGRKCNEVRPIWCEAGLLPRAHGSGIFTRGSTQVLSAVTLGTTMDAKPIDGIWPDREQTFYHHYNFPPYSVGEARSMRATGRREIGHGALAEKAIVPSLPPRELFSYVIRIVSDVLSSNGSSSMASTCGSTLALMDAGVPISQPVAGIAMGMILEDETCAILSDIQGVEDFLGDMDFKVTGSQNGVTAIQLDIKLAQGITLGMLKVALDQALIGRKHILNEMLKALDSPRTNLSPHAPRLLTVTIDPDCIGAVIGPGGKNIKKLIEETGVENIDIADDGLVTIAGHGPGPELAKQRIESITLRIEPGKEYPGLIVRKLDFGLFIEFAPGKTGLIRFGGGRSGRGGNRNASNEGQAPPEENNSLVDYQIGDKVLAVVSEIDMKGRINIATIRSLS